MEIFGPHLNALFLRPFLDDAESTLGKPRVDEFLAGFGVKRAEIDSPTAWVTLEFGETFVDELSKLSGDPTMIERCGRLAFSPKYVGMLGPILKVLGTPKMAYGTLEKGLPRFNKVGQMRVVPKGLGHLVVEYASLPGAPHEHRATVCETRKANLAGMTTMFDLPPAAVTHEVCMARGADTCVYDVRYVEPIRRLRSTLGLLLGAGIGAGALLLGWPLWSVVLSALGLALAGFAIGRWLELGDQVRARLGEITELRDALTRSAFANEERFGEVLEAKAGVERKVEERTAELSVTTTKLEETLLAVRELDKAKTDFFGNVSHDLRTPLTMILGPLDEMREGREPVGGAKAAVETMHRNALRLLRLINQLLDLAKVDAGGTELQRTTLEPVELARAVMEPFASTASARRIEMRVDVDAPVGPIFADAGWLESALSNLVGNAMKFVPGGGHVTLRVVDRGHEVGFDVIDDGPGIAATDLPKLFDRFAQGNDAGARRGGTGIGLAIVHEAARLHGGEASVVSAPGEGACFSLRIPRRAMPDADLPTDVTVQLHAAAPRPGGQPSAAVDIVGAPTALAATDGPFPGAPLALVVEDNDEIRALIGSVLASRYRVREARNGREGLDLLSSLTEAPAIIVSDVAMPVMDGLAFVRALRADPRTRPLPVVMLTARRDVTHVLEAFDAGADDYVTKPFHARELLARIDVRVRLNQLIGEMAHRERLATLGVLAASVAHQVRNPLTSIRVGLPLMRAKLGEQLDARSREMLDVMIDGSERMERLTTDLLDLSRVDREVDGHCHPGDGLLAATRLIQARLPAGVNLETHVAPGLEMVGRPGDLNQLFLNVLDNAARAVGERGTISVAASAGSDGIDVRIGDSGPGIRASIVPRLFQPFMTTRAAGEGTGLGLAIAKQIVDAHGGTIVAGHSDLGGALFTIHLPSGSLAPLTA